MQRTQPNGRKIKISPALDVEERFHQKRLGLIKYVLHEKHNILLHNIQLNYEKRSAMVNGQVIIKTRDDGALKCNRYNNIDDDVQKVMTEWLTKNSSQRL